MNNKTIMVVVITAIVVLVLRDKLTGLPGVSKIPTV